MSRDNDQDSVERRRQRLLSSIERAKSEGGPLAQRSIAAAERQLASLGESSEAAPTTRAIEERKPFPPQPADRRPRIEEDREAAIVDARAVVEAVPIGLEREKGTPGTFREEVEKHGAHDVLHVIDSITYEEASGNPESGGDLRIGRTVYKSVKKLGQGGKNIAYKAELDGRTVVMKVSQSPSIKVGDSPGRIARSERTYSDGEVIVGSDRDEFAIRLLKSNASNVKVCPDVIQTGAFSDGRLVTVLEYVESRVGGSSGLGRYEKLVSPVAMKDGLFGIESPSDMFDIEKMRSKSVGFTRIEHAALDDSKLAEASFFEKGRLRKQREALQTNIDLFTSGLVLAIHDSIHAAQLLCDNNISNTDLKPNDYIVDISTRDGLKTPKDLEKAWRGVYVDWGNTNMIADHKTLSRSHKERIVRMTVAPMIRQAQQRIDALRQFRRRDPDEVTQAFCTFVDRALAKLERVLDECKEVLDAESDDNFEDQLNTALAGLTQVGSTAGLKKTKLQVQL